MRIQTTLDVGRGVCLPINYNYPLASIIYRFLEQSDPEYAGFLHDEGYEAGGKRLKFFTFSRLIAARKPQTLGDEIILCSPVTWHVSSPMEMFLSNFATSLLQVREIRIEGVPLRVRDVQVLPAPKLRPRMTFRCSSPITISTKREWQGKLATHYCLPDDPEFSDLVRQNLIRKFEALHGQSPRDDRFAMKFDSAYIRKRSRVTCLVHYKGIAIRGVMCPFHVEGSPELIHVGYECGFGDKNSAGFGMVEAG